MLARQTSSLLLASPRLRRSAFHALFLSRLLSLSLPPSLLLSLSLCFSLFVRVCLFGCAGPAARPGQTQNPACRYRGLAFELQPPQLLYPHQTSQPPRSVMCRASTGPCRNINWRISVLSLNQRNYLVRLYLQVTRILSFSLFFSLWYKCFDLSLKNDGGAEAKNGRLTASWQR